MSFGNSYPRMGLMDQNINDDFPNFQQQTDQGDVFSMQPSHWEMNFKSDFHSDNNDQLSHYKGLQKQDFGPLDHLQPYQYGDGCAFNSNIQYQNYTYEQVQPDHNLPNSISNNVDQHNNEFSVKFEAEPQLMKEAASSSVEDNSRHDDYKSSSTDQTNESKSSRQSLEIDESKVEIASDDNIRKRSSLQTGKCKGQKRGKTSFQNDDIQFISNQRKDVVVRSLLRLIRRYYQTRFNRVTNYIKDKKRKDNTYFLEQLDVYIENLLKEKNKAVKKQMKDDREFKEELQLFLGSMFYHKEMLKIFTEQEIKDKIEVIRKSLYGFSIKSLERLFKESRPFRFLIDHIQAHKQKVIQLLDHEKVESAMPEDYETGFQLLAQLNDTFRDEK